MSRDALIVGINTYDHLHSLKSPAEDAEAVARRLEQYGDFHVRRLHAVKDESNSSGRLSRQMPVTVTDLEEALLTLLQPAGKNIPDTALFYFSGHGLRRDRRVYQEGYLATSEADSLDKWGLPLQWLRRLLEESRVRQQVIWLDCCFSGELLNFDEANPGSRGNVRDRCFIAASRDFEAAYEDTAGTYGLLTGVLLQALDPSRSESEIITNYSLSDFISKHLRSAIQQPVFTNFGQPITLIRPDRAVKRIKAVSDEGCPYKGLSYFDCNEEDPKYFFGRAALTDQLLEKVRQSHFVAVLGPSGSGKTSVVRAGLLHQLQIGRRLSGSETWPIRLFRPGEHPLRNLALSFLDPSASLIDRADQLKKAEALISEGAVGLDRLIRATADEGRVVLVVDQFEESFTLCRTLTERQTFFECLLKALPGLEQKICLVMTMRADFFGKCAEQPYAGLSELIQEHLVTVTPMTAEELTEAITEPAKKAGSTVQSELVSQMIEDVKDSPGSLPLLQYTLTELWNRREADEMTLAAYTRLGGVKGTLARRADEVYENLSEQEQEIARRIFIELTQLGEGTEDTRRQVSKQGLFTSKEPEPIVEEVIQKLADAKLIVTGRVQMKGAEDTTLPVVDVAHEALIRHWPRLRNWLNENRDEIRFQRRLDEAARHWQSHKKAQGLLWRSPDLDLLEKFHDKNARQMPGTQQEFYRASVKARNKAKRDEEESRRRELENERQLREKAEMLARAQEQTAEQERLSREKSEVLATEQKEKIKAQRKANLFLMGLITLMFIAAFIIYLYAGIQKESLNKVQTLLAKNYWFNAISAKKENNILKSLHFFARSGKKEKKALEIKNCILNIQADLNLFLSKEIRHDEMRGLILSQDESLILTWSGDGTARLWNIGADYDLPTEHLTLLVEAATGTVMDDYGNVSVLTKEEWENKKEEYITIAEKHLTTCKFKEYNLYQIQKRF
jgi:flagellar biosynthesis GTPase FlhF